ncbi:hypothetical protein [Escherichia sp. E2586]|uniref:hypothetical protein n=1 Tax=Escherichia sp. E2586 TaxID=2044457 RepID=UPI001F0D5655|nr:hypothetical protein [Escherichia sp. E2586]
MSIRIWKKVNYISLSLIQKIDDRSRFGSKSELCIYGENTGITIPADYLETAILLDDGRYLLFVTEDVPYEESLELLLIDIKQDIQEQMTIAVPYGSGTLREMRLYENHIEFSYFSDETWRVEVSSSRFFRLPFQYGFLVTRHPFRLSYFIHIKLFR